MKVVWMYHDIMDLYGDKGNMMVLKKRCLDRGIPFELDTCGIGEEKDLSEYDLIFLGGGADKEQIRCFKKSESNAGFKLEYDSIFSPIIE